MDGDICQTCLSRGRRLTAQHTLREMFREINIWELSDQGGVCWECYHILLKFTKFKTQVQYAQESINLKVQDVKSLSCLSLFTKTCYDYQFCHSSDPLTGERKPKTQIVKKECIKEQISSKNQRLEQNVDNKPKFTEVPVLGCIDLYEASDHQNDIYDNGDELTNLTDDEKPLLDTDNVSSMTIYAETLKPKVKLKTKNQRQKRIKKVVKKEYDDEEEVKEKFYKVVFTEQEMIKNREEKRNHPNFKKIPFKCDSCVLGFTRKETYDVHMEKKHSEKIGKFMCDVCHIRFPTKRHVERHVGKHFARYRCRLCAYDTSEQWSARGHCRAKHRADRPRRIHCAQCDRVAETPEELAEHVRTHHSLYCNECGEKFKGKHTLRTHLTRIHSVKREFVCDVCARAFATKSRLETHMVSHDPCLARRLAYCDRCRVQYKNIYVYRSHVRNSASHAERKYSCPDCNKKFVSKIYFTKHYNFYHLKKSEFNCEICNKLFISDWRLKNHRQKHHGLSRQRDHPCNICGKKFYTGACLRGHRLTHSSERAYMCSVCGDTFKQRPALYTHARLVHGPGGRPGGRGRRWGSEEW